MTLKPFKYAAADSLETAQSLLKQQGEGTAVLAGGTDLMGALKDTIHATPPQLVISLKPVKDLSYVKADSAGMRIGALTTLAEIAKHPAVRENYPLLAAAAQSVASPQIRNVATLAGNLCQEPRCWYYRNPGNTFDCLRKGGDLCNAFTGENQFHSIFGVVCAETAPCASECPAGNAIPAYFSKVRAGDLMGAATTLLETNPLPAVTGRVCPHFCEQKCSRDTFDEAVSIWSVERVVGDFILEKRGELLARPERETGKRIAVVGSGPAGLAAAFYLRRRGHAVTVFDRWPEAGGMLRYGIPAFRLPKEIVEQQVQLLAETGVEFRLGTEVGANPTVDALQNEFDAVFLACGAWKERPLGIEGEEYAESGLGFLNKVAAARQEGVEGQQVAVIGGGNVAIDVARTLRRLGATPVVVYRRTVAEMPAIAEEVQKAQEEGIEFQFLTAPLTAKGADGKVILRCARMQLGAPDASGRPRPVPIEGSEFETAYDRVMKAIGEQADVSLLPGNVSLNGLSDYGLGGKLFAGGDFVSGPSTVVEAIKAGREAATRMNGHLGTLQSPNGAGKPRGQSLESWGKLALENARRRRGAELPLAERLKSVAVEVAGGLSWEQVQDEVNRCRNCGCVASSPSDTAPALIALGAKVKTTKREIEAEELFAAPVLKSTVLDSDELVTEIQIPAPKPNTKTAFLKYRVRQSIDFPIVCVAAIVTLNGDKVETARIVLGAVAPVPLRAREAEAFLQGKMLTEEVAAGAAEVAVKGAMALGKNRYKIQLTDALVKRAILTCLASAH